MLHDAWAALARNPNRWPLFAELLLGLVLMPLAVVLLTLFLAGGLLVSGVCAWWRARCARARVTGTAPVPSRPSSASVLYTPTA